MEREGRGENFVKRNRLNIVASSVAAITIAAGVGAVEKSGSFDPITDSADFASHLVLKSPQIAYEQLIDILPRAENAEADTPTPAPTPIETPTPTPVPVPDIVCCGGKTISFIKGSGATDSDVQNMRYQISTFLLNTTHGVTYVSESTTNAIHVEVYRNNTAVLGGEQQLLPPPPGSVRVVRIDLSDVKDMVNHLVGLNVNDKHTVDVYSDLWILAHEFGHLNGEGDPQTKENIVLDEMGAGLKRLIYKVCQQNGDVGSDLSVGNRPGYLDATAWNNARIAAGGFVSTEPCISIGGIVELLDSNDFSTDINSEESDDNTLPIATGAVGVIGVIGAAGAVLYINRRRSS